jgi:hypothetical protein
VKVSTYSYKGITKDDSIHDLASKGSSDGMS